MAKTSARRGLVVTRPTPALAAAVERTVRVVAGEAERAASGACAVLQALGLLGSPVPIPLDLMLKLGAMMRIYQWEEAELTQFLHAALPPAERVMNDVLHPAPGEGGAEFDGRELAQRVFRTWYRQFAFDHVAPGAEVVITGIDPAAVVAQLAEFLWRHRHLGTPDKES